MQSNDSECDHCDGTGSIYEPAPDDAAHEYDCYGHEIPCDHCDGTGTVALPGARPSSEGS